MNKAGFGDWKTGLITDELEMAIRSSAEAAVEVVAD